MHGKNNFRKKLITRNKIKELKTLIENKLKLLEQQFSEHIKKYIKHFLGSKKVTIKKLKFYEHITVRGRI